MPGPYELIIIFGMFLVVSMPMIAIAAVLYFLLFKKKK